MTRSRRKLLVVSSSLGEGGAQRVTSTLLRHLSRDTFDIRLCLFKRVIEFSMPENVPVTTLLDRDLSLSARPWLVPGALLRLRREIIETRPDVVFSVIDQVNLVVAVALAGVRPRARWIARAGANPDCQSGAQRLCARWAYRHADAVVANAAGLARGLTELYPGAAERIVHLANPIDFDRLDELAAVSPARSRDQAKPLIVSVGRLVKEKRPDLLVEAAARLKRRRPFELWICGDGPMTAALRDQIRALELDRDVTLLGFCNNPYAILAQADAFVMTSDFEGLPNGLIEAQGLGVPAVSTDCRYGPSEIMVHGETGFLVRLGDPEAVADSLDLMLSDDERRAEMGRASVQRVRSRYAVDVLIEKWERLLVGSPPAR